MSERLVVTILAIFLESLPVMLIWDYILIDVFNFGLIHINYWQALGITVLLVLIKNYLKSILSK